MIYELETLGIGINSLRQFIDHNLSMPSHTDLYREEAQPRAERVPLPLTCACVLLTDLPAPERALLPSHESTTRGHCLPKIP